MGLFFPDDDSRLPPGRRYGFARYRELLERDFKQMILMDFITLGLCIPYALGVGYALLCGSLLVLIPAAALGGMIASWGIAAMYDFLLRRMRDSEIWFWFAFVRSMKQNWRSSLLPGATGGVFLGFLLFSGMVMWRTGTVSAGNVALLAASCLLVLMVYSVWWPQTVLFEQRPSLQLKNCILFILKYPLRVLGASLLQMVWWTVTVLLLPWSAFLVPFLGVWYIMFVSLFLLYDRLNEAFRVEEQIKEKGLE